MPTAPRPAYATSRRSSSIARSLAAAEAPATGATSPTELADGTSTNAVRLRSFRDRPPVASPSSLAGQATPERPPGAVTSGIAAAAGSSPPPAAFRMLAAVVLALTALLTPLLWLAPLPRPIPYLSLIERPG